MRFFKNLFKDKCPTCYEILQLKSGEVFFSKTIKSCPKGHYEREFHPALESYIETIRT